MVLFRYLFGDQSKYFIRAPDTHWLIALTCLNYLCFKSLNDIFFQDTNGEEIKREILEGNFIIFHYAATQWIHHVKKCAKELRPDYLQSLCETINEFYALRCNQLSNYITPQRSACIDFVSFAKWPDVQRFLALVQDFQYKLEIGHLHTDGIYSPYEQKLNVLADNNENRQGKHLDGQGSDQNLRCARPTKRKN